MNDSGEIWNLPWHALQKDLALGLGTDKPGRPVGSVSAISWLSRARLRAAPRAQTPMRQAQTPAG